MKVSYIAGGTEKSEEVVTVKVRTLVMREREWGRLKGDDHVSTLICVVVTRQFSSRVTYVACNLLGVYHI